MGKLKSYYSEQPGQFLEQVLIVPDLRLRIPNCIYIQAPMLRIGKYTLGHIVL